MTSLDNLLIEISPEEQARTDSKMRIKAIILDGLTANKQVRYLDIMRYFVNYYDSEHQLVQAIQSNSSETLSLFIKYKNSYMSVGRNFKAGKDELILKELLNFKNFEGNYVECFSNQLREKGFLSKNNAISAASKFLWLIKNDTIIIDTNNRHALKIEEGDYQKYCNTWRTKYDEVREQIISLVTTHTLQVIDPIFAEEWFRMRVFDQFLWSWK